MVQGEVHGVEDSSANEVFVMAAAMNDSGVALFSDLFHGALGEAGTSRLLGSRSPGRPDEKLNRVTGVENHRVSS